MRWLSFFILAYVALGLQSGLARAIEWHGASPDLVLLGVVFVAISAPRNTALLAGFLLGLMHDFLSNESLGLYPFCYGAAALVIVGVAQAINGRHPAMHFFLTLLVGWMIAVILSLHELLRPIQPGVHAPLGPLFASAVYSALLAPIMVGFLQNIGGVFQFRTARGRM